MATWKGIVRSINKIARIAKDVESVASGDPRKMAKRIENRSKGKFLGKIGFWK